jgi:hypothetical protein
MQASFNPGVVMARNPSDSLRATLAENIKAFRSTQELSHRTYIGSVERQERNVTLSTLEVISVALGTSVPELLSRQRNKK